ncbi:unnamed protein product [Prunus armeniaca]
MQSVFLGSDRRYNRYWLFLDPCNAYDPGHRRVYIESSEDGHWEVIDTEEVVSQTSGDMVRPDNYKMTIASVLAACAHLGAFDHGLWVHEFTCWKKFLEVCSNIHFVLNFRLQCHEFYFHSDTSRSNKIRLHDYMTEFGYKHKTYRALHLFINFVITTDPSNVEYIHTKKKKLRKLWQDMGKKTKKPGKGKEKAAKAEEKRARREAKSSHLRMTSIPFR